MKKYLLLATLVATLAAADDGCPPDCCAFLPSARPCVRVPELLCQSDIYTQLSVLYWECSERGLDFAIKNTQPQFNSDLNVHKPGFNWEPALRLMLGFHLPHDNWRLDLTYSFYLHNIHSRVKHNFDPASAATFGEGILAVWTSPGAFLSQNIYARWQYADSKWKIHANFFDLLLRHDLCNGQALSFQPAFGLKMAILQQRYDVFYTSGNIVFPSTGGTETLLSSTIHMKNRSFNIGPEAEMATRWCLSPRWSILGSLSGALLASEFTVGRNEYDVSTTTSTVIGSFRNNYDFWTYRPQAAVSLGVQWSDCACRKDNVIHYGFAASYEAQYWWKQNMLLRHIDAPIPQSNVLAPVQGDLYFHGLTFDILIDF